MQHHVAEKAQTQADAEAYQQMQQQAAMEQAAQQAAAQQAAPAADPVAQLQELGKLKEQGVLTEEEFAAQKAKILGQ
jgi:hypothetical protein